MSVPQVWQASRALAEVWQKSRLVNALRTQLPRNSSSSAGITEALRNIDAGSRFVSTEPLLPNKWELVAPQMPLVDSTTPGLAVFLTKMRPIGFAAETTTAWLRSRLPGYPMIPVPHLAVNTHLTAEEIWFGLLWRREALQAGLQFESSPRGVSELLGVDRQEYNHAALELAKALESTPEWLAFDGISRQIAAEDREQLAEARRKLKPLLSADAVSAHEPERGHRRYMYRKEQVAEAVEGLTGRAADFAQSFEAVSDLIDLVSLRVLGQLIAFGDPVQLTDVYELERKGHRITFQSTDPVPPAALIQIASPLTPDAAIVNNVSMYFEETGEMKSTYDARILSGFGTS
ncbi:hypothetical protein IA539_09945 [Gordonia sp. zg691]|uniref:hypothetical protein n=1 Tax=Gordonia jinghuaiqii TaxID=2758710 RepID=UPI0016626373|nr:hypothetical protein [Gordonia jinghuaiqii]MBD0861531.1 hypothetical protein [Gordonia jinghuaiqii]